MAIDTTETNDALYDDHGETVTINGVSATAVVTRGGAKTDDDMMPADEHRSRKASIRVKAATGLSKDDIVVAADGTTWRVVTTDPEYGEIIGEAESVELMAQGRF